MPCLPSKDENQNPAKYSAGEFSAILPKVQSANTHSYTIIPNFGHIRQRAGRTDAEPMIKGKILMIIGFFILSKKSISYSDFQ